MGKIAGIGLLLVSVSAVIGVDYQAALKGRQADSYSLSDHLSARVAGLKTVAATVALPASGLEAMLPPVPEGWTVRDGVPEDNFAVTGQTPDETRRTLMSAIEKATYGAMSGEKLTRKFYRSGDRMMFLELLFVPGDAVASDGARRLDQLFGMLEKQGEATGLSLDGDVRVVRLTGSAFVTGHGLMGRKGRQVYVSMSSNVSERDALAFFGGIDMAALNRMAADDPGPDTVPPLESGLGDGGPVADAGAMKVPQKFGGSCEKRGAGTFCSATE